MLCRAGPSRLRPLALARNAPPRPLLSLSPRPRAQERTPADAPAHSTTAASAWAHSTSRPSPSSSLLLPHSLSSARPTSPSPSSSPLHLARRSYQHSSRHAPANRDKPGNPHTDTDGSEATTLADGPSFAYSRHELLADWHSYSRKVSPLDVGWDGEKDQIDANCASPSFLPPRRSEGLVLTRSLHPPDLILRQDGEIEQPKDKLVKQDVIKEYGLLVRPRPLRPRPRALSLPSSTSLLRGQLSLVLDRQLTLRPSQPRDLRSLDAHILDVRPALVVCQRSLILCTPVVRAIIASDSVGTDKHNPICTEAQSIDLARAMQQVMRYLELSGSATGQDNVPPFELRALEALLLLNSRGIKNVVTELQERVYRTIPQLRFGVSPAELRDLLECKRTVEDCLMSGRAMQSALSTVLGEGASSFSLSLSLDARDVGLERHD
mgnify:CR=1 FL=1